jgi:hypothetical protein
MSVISNTAPDPNGVVLQIVSAFDGDYSTYANTNVDSPAELTNLNVTLTPSTTNSKILLQGFMTGNSTNTSVQYISFFFKRGITTIGVGNSASRNGTEGEIFVSGILSADYSKPTTITGLYIDSPATTSAITYKMFGFANHYTSSLQNSTLVLNSGGYDYNNKEQAVGTSGIIAMEIAG